MMQGALRIAMVRGPGGLPGIEAHIGAWLAWRTACMPQAAWLGGCSAGAIVSALDASGMTPERAWDLIEGLRTGDVIRKRFARWLRIRHLDSLYDPAPIAALLDRHVSASWTDLRCPLALAATRMDSDPERPVIFNGGMTPLRQAVLASMSIAGVWPYATVDGGLYTDGGTRNQIVAPPLVQGWDLVVVLNIVRQRSFAQRDRNVVSRLLWNIEELMDAEPQQEREELEAQLGRRLLWIDLDIGDTSALEFSPRHQAMAAAYQQAAERIKAYKRGCAASTPPHPQEGGMAASRSGAAAGAQRHGGVALGEVPMAPGGGPGAAGLGPR